jgi:hypothetical protein
VLADLRQGHGEQGVDIGQSRLELQRPSKRNDGVGKASLLEVDQAQPRVDFGHLRLQLHESFVCLSGFGIAPLRQRALTLLNYFLNASGVGLRSTTVRGRRCQDEDHDQRTRQTGKVHHHRGTRSRHSTSPANLPPERSMMPLVPKLQRAARHA